MSKSRKLQMYVDTKLVIMPTLPTSCICVFVKDTIPRIHFRHYHSMEVFANYDILDYQGNKVADGHKASFCLEDVECMPGASKRYECVGYSDQGMSHYQLLWEVTPKRCKAINWHIHLNSIHKNHNDTMEPIR